MDNLFDKVAFDIGDIVINKNKAVDKNAHVVREVKVVSNESGFKYLVLFFNDDTTFHVAYEYEPFDAKERKLYYEIWNKNKKKKKNITKAAHKVKHKSKREVLTFDINKIKNGTDSN